MPKHATKIHITKFLRMTVRLQVKVCGRGLGQLPIGCTSALSDTKAQLQLQLRPLALNKCYMYIAFLLPTTPGKSWSQVCGFIHSFGCVFLLHPLYTIAKSADRYPRRCRVHYIISINKQSAAGSVPSDRDAVDRLGEGCEAAAGRSHGRLEFG